MPDPLVTGHLQLPYIAAAQAQKHVTHNEALRLLDTIVQLAVLDSTIAVPPSTPADGDRYIVAASGTGAWSGHDGEVATWVDGAWAFAEPQEGWLAFDIAAEAILVRLSGAWQPVAAAPGTVDMLGINATADTTNRLAVRSGAVLFSAIEAADGGNGDVRFTVNKETDADTASILFQSGWSGRAEVGLAGDTDLVFKVSPDGSAWTEAIRIDKDTGLPTILYDNGTSGLTATDVQGAIDEIAAGGGGGAVASVFGRSGAVAAAASDYDASQVDNDSGVSGTTVKDALNTLDTLVGGKQAGDADLTAIAGLSPANDDVIQRKAGAWTNRTMAQLKADLAITAPDIVAGVSNTEFGYLDGVTSAIQTQIDAKAPLASPALTGTPAAPTASGGTNTTQIATTAFVAAAIAALSTVYQAIATILGAIASLGSNGLIARTGSGTVAARTITAGTGIAVSNGSGASGDPTVALDGTPSNLASVNTGALRGFTNLLMNPDGRFNQRAPATNADDTYGHDRWYALTQTSTIAVSTVSDAESGTPKMWRLTQSQATAQRMGYAQIVEGANCKHLRGKTVTLSGRIKFSLNAAVRYAILEWTGTEDAVTSDVVNSWTNGTFTAGNFFASSNLTVRAVGSMTPSAATLTDLTALTATLGTSFNNLIVFIWTEGTAAQNATLDGTLQLEVGSVASAREFRPVTAEITLCQRYYERATFSASWYQASGNVGGPYFTFETLKRAVPTMTRISGSFGGSQAAAPTVTGYAFVTGFRYTFTNNALGVVWDDNSDVGADAEL